MPLSESELVDGAGGFRCGAMAEVRPCDAARWLGNKTWQHARVSQCYAVCSPHCYSALVFRLLAEDLVFPLVVLLPMLRP